jgi:hypothetical protein
MKEIIKDSTGALGRIFSRLAMERKKVVLALCLISLMVFMWTKVLLNKKPQSALAILQTEQAAQKPSGAQLKISFIDLPRVRGRNDVLARDFFNVGNWRDFIRSGEKQNIGGIERVNVFSNDDSEETARRIADKLKLEAISLGEKPQAFVNNKLLAVGDEFIVSDGVNSTCECEVVKIEENKVTVRCGRIEIWLKLTQMSSNDY